MLKLAGIVLASVLGISLTGSAQGAALPAVLTVGVQIATLPQITFGGATTVVVNGSGVGGHISQLSVPPSAFGTTGFLVDVTDPAANPIHGLLATVQNGAGVFSETGGGAFAGTMALNGVTKICLFSDCNVGPAANISVPVNAVGVGGSATASLYVNVTVFGSPWASVAAIGTVTQMGMRHGPGSGTSSTAAPSGVINLVTPIFLTTNINASAIIPAFAFLDIHIVPEPGTLLLLGSGVASLAAVGRRKLHAAEQREHRR